MALNTAAKLGLACGLAALAAGGCQQTRTEEPRPWSAPVDPSKQQLDAASYGHDIGPMTSEGQLTDFRRLVEEAQGCEAEAAQKLAATPEKPEDKIAETRSAVALLEKAWGLYQRALDIHADAATWDRLQDVSRSRAAAREALEKLEKS